MRIAIIDLGTVSVRFEIYEIDLASYRLAPFQSIKRLHKERTMLRLGEGLYQTKKLSLSGREKALAAFQEIKNTLKTHQTELVCTAATSALREADDGPEFITSLEESFGFPIQVISGGDEAKLTARGIMAYESLPDGNYAMVDIGGGSTEISLCCKRQVISSVSLPFGAIRCHELFLKSSPPPSGDNVGIEAFRTYLRQGLKEAQELTPKEGISVVVGSSASIKTISRLAYGDVNIDLGLVSRQRVAELVQTIAPLTLEGIKALPGMEANRADIILSGVIIFEEIMEFLGAEELQPTAYSLRHGLLDEEVNRILKRHESN